MSNNSKQDIESQHKNEKSFDSKAFLKTVPHKPGVYRMLSEDQKILYVGKAKDLKNRVSSYFRGNIVNSRTYSMVKQIRDVQVTITATEAEALLLENDKSYPYIYLSSHKFPRLTFHRGAKKGKGQYFGPYPSAGAFVNVRIVILVIVQDLVCNTKLSDVLRHCTNEITEEDYQQQGVSHTIKFLQGKSQQVIEELVGQMDQASSQLNFEQAANFP
ncbi:UvrABC system protein C [Nymphon striatum]|nr:UvrABC system protein C [Nymphon striatum]